MKKHILGKTGIDVSEISFGTVSLGLPYGIGTVNESDMLLEEDSIELLNQALNNGINFFDSALGSGGIKLGSRLAWQSPNLSGIGMRCQQIGGVKSYSVRLGSPSSNSPLSNAIGSSI